jgi:protein ImuA
MVMSKLEALRMQIRALEGRHLETGQDEQVLSFEDGRLNAPLPHGGFKLGALHEFRSYGLEAELAPAVTAFAATVAARILRVREGYALWALCRADCYAPGLIRFGLDPARIVWIECRKDAEVLGVMEEALHSLALAAVIGEAGTLSLKTGRRLDAASRRSGVTALLLRRPFFKSSKTGSGPSAAASTRWRVSAVPYRHPGAALPAPHRHSGTGLPVSGIAKSIASLPFKVPDTAVGGSGTQPGLGPPCWRLDLEYCRNGRPASWIVEALDGSDGEGLQAGHVRVVAELCNDVCEEETAPARKTQRTARAS